MSRPWSAATSSTCCTPPPSFWLTSTLSKTFDNLPRSPAAWSQNWVALSTLPRARYSTCLSKLSFPVFNFLRHSLVTVARCLTVPGPVTTPPEQDNVCQLLQPLQYLDPFVNHFHDETSRLVEDLWSPRCRLSITHLRLLCLEDLDANRCTRFLQA